jgi:hypothetical protein
MEVDRRRSFGKPFDKDDFTVSFNKYALWLRGYFFPPSNKDDPVIYPKDMHASPIHVVDTIVANKHKKQKVLPSKKNKRSPHINKHIKLII